MKTKPVIAALLSCCCILALSSCDKEDVKLTRELYFEADMDGKSMLLPEGKDGYESKATVYTTANTLGCVESQNMLLTKTNDTKKSLEISFVKQQTSCASSCTQSKAMLQEGAYAYRKETTSSDQITVDGVIIRYTDIYGKVWRTDLRSADHSNNSFTVTSIEENKMDNRSEMLVTAEFNCTLYDADGNEMTITNGKIVSRSIVCN
ncbi:hypothetical protein ABID22_003416 [Pontibacter aydingkolensis]|uniref:Lipoprotein n=1 Tax=Pontibacter aydingkolensis TaxID=1911536 RepID=A0ABS7CYA7_9BACT|nr:hypothetical protein [Pontibacter aydingkolensis]MBW7468802.1 hypothetical protein [Pontibacter aydingkolensis]